MGLPVSSPSSMELRGHHFILKTSKKAELMEKSTDLPVSTMKVKTQGKWLSSRLEEQISNYRESQLTRAVTHTQNPLWKTLQDKKT
jgi:hypothetical protein